MFQPTPLSTTTIYFNSQIKTQIWFYYCYKYSGIFVLGFIKEGGKKLITRAE